MSLSWLRLAAQNGRTGGRPWRDPIGSMLKKAPCSTSVGQVPHDRIEDQKISCYGCELASSPSDFGHQSQVQTPTKHVDDDKHLGPTGPHLKAVKRARCSSEQSPSGASRHGHQLGDLRVHYPGAVVRKSVLSQDVRVNSYAELKSSIIFNHVDIGPHCRNLGAIIDRDVPEDTVIGYDREEHRRNYFVT
jgi:hypothetical protein